VNASKVPLWNGPAPKPRDASVAAQRLVDLANMVPRGKWASYGDLSDAYIARHRENMVARGVASALSLLPVNAYIEERLLEDQQPRVNQWHVPWHRIRLTDGRAVSRKFGAVPSDDYVNQMFVNEGGVLRHGAATDGCRFNLIGAVRSAQPSGRQDPDVVSQSAPPRRELTDEQRARLAARAEERRHRLSK